MMLAKIVSRDTALIGKEGICRATIESVLENGSDAVIAPIFWFAILGAPGALLHRLANTLDAMWGYKTERYSFFGYTAARADDLLNWIPARCCALLYAFSGDTRCALRCWREQAHRYESPNAGAVMASGSGALQIVTGGSTSYHGISKQRPHLGHGEPAAPIDIQRSIQLLQKSLFGLLLALACTEVLLCAIRTAVN